MKKTVMCVLGIVLMVALALGAVKVFVIDQRTVSTTDDLLALFYQTRESLPPIPSPVGYQTVADQLAEGRYDFIAAPNWAYTHDAGTFYAAERSKLARKLDLPMELVAYEDLTSGKVVLAGTSSTGRFESLAIVDAPELAAYDERVSLENHLMKQLWPRRVIWTATLKPEADAWNDLVQTEQATSFSIAPIVMAMSAPEEITLFEVVQDGTNIFVNLPDEFAGADIILERRTNLVSGIWHPISTNQAASSGTMFLAYADIPELVTTGTVSSNSVPCPDHTIPDVNCTNCTTSVTTNNISVSGGVVFYRTSAVSTNDTDSDGLDNVSEYGVGTDYQNSDTDDDALSDGAEVLAKETDPLNPDSDGDGLIDGIDMHPLNPGPQISISYPAEGAVSTNSQILVEGLAVFDGTIGTVLVGSLPATLTATTNGCGFSATVNLDDEGEQAIYVQAWGQTTNGLELESEAKRTVVVDAAAPILSFVSCADGDTFTNLFVHFSVQTDDPASVYLAGEPMARDGFMNYGWAELEPGTNTVAAVSMDAYGRSGTKAITVYCDVPSGYTESPPVDSDKDGVIDSEDPAPNDPSVQGNITVESVTNGSVVTGDGGSSTTVQGSAPAYSTVTITVGGITQTVTADAFGFYSANANLLPGQNAITVSGSGFQTTSYVSLNIPPPRLEFLLEWSVDSLSNSMNIAYSSPGSLSTANGTVVVEDPSFGPTAQSAGAGYTKALVADAGAGSYILRMDTEESCVGTVLYNYWTKEYDWSRMPLGPQAKIVVLENGRVTRSEVRRLRYTGSFVQGAVSETHVAYDYIGKVLPWEIGHFVVHSGTNAGGYVVQNMQRALAPQAGHMGYTCFTNMQNVALSGPNGTAPVDLQPGQATQFDLEGDFAVAGYDVERVKLNTAFSGPVDATGVFAASICGRYQVGIADNLVRDTNGVYYTSIDVPPIDVVVTSAVSKVEMVTPFGDPVNSPIDSGAGQNEFTFSANSPGVLTMNLKARVDPPGMAQFVTNDCVFTVDAIGSSTKAWAAANPGGRPTANGDYLEATVTFTGLPANNSDFGRKQATISYNDGALTNTAAYEVFFDTTAANHPEGAAGDPNWFYYWKVGAVCGIETNVVYDPTANYSWCDPGTDNWIRLGTESAKTNDGPYTFTFGTNSITATGSGIGIYCVAENIQHEQEHLNIYNTFGIDIFAKPPEDPDGDAIPTTAESVYGGISTVTTNADTYNVWGLFNALGVPPSQNDYDKYGDNELRARMGESPLTISVFPDRDWSNPGTQSK